MFKATNNHLYANKNNTEALLQILKQVEKKIILWLSLGFAYFLGGCSTYYLRTTRNEPPHMPSVPLWVHLSSTFTAAPGPASPFCPVPRCQWSWGPPGAGTAAAAANLHGAGCCATARCLPPGSGASLQLPSMAEHLKLTLQEICCFLGVGIKRKLKISG